MSVITATAVWLQFGEWSRYGVAMLLGFLISIPGDIFLELTPRKHFLIGTALFAVMHFVCFNCNFEFLLFLSSIFNLFRCCFRISWID